MSEQVTPPTLLKHEVGNKNSRESKPVPDKNVLHWFRRGLRLHDNPALSEALTDATTFRCVYILDPWFAASQHSINKWRFLIQCLDDLDQSLRKLNSRLFVIHGQPADVLSRYIQQWKITHLSFEDDPEPFGRERDTVIKTLAKEAGVEVIVRVAHTLYDIKNIIQVNKNRIPFTYKKFQRIMQIMDPAETPVHKITKESIGDAKTPMQPDQDDLYAVPKLSQLGFDTQGLSKSSVWNGGETEALYRLDRHLERKAWVASFEQPRMTTQSLMASPTGLSPYLRFGCLSARLFYWKLYHLYCKIKPGIAAPVSLFGQLYWREFFYTVASDNPKFDRMIGNPICLQVPWNVDAVALAKWAEGKTGFPWIDAIMTQLKQEGWIHPLARHSVACFLTRGDLWLSWEDGMKIFDELLLDADWSTNAGMWMWLSCSSFFHQFFYTYDPILFGKRMDPNGDYIRKYLPVLRSYPSEYIFEPWTAPRHVQELVKCVIGRDYPKPMIDHSKALRINMEKMKAVYQQVLTKTKLSRTNQQKAVYEFMTQAPSSAPLSTASKMSNNGAMPSFGE